MSKKIGPYLISENIGVGSFSTVYKAAHTNASNGQIDAVVAIKAIEMNRLNAKLQEAMESEIEILEKIRHKNIVRLFGCQKTKQHIYLILEYCAGGDLHHYIKRQGYLSAEVARHFLRELAQGLEFLWRHNLVHRDLKPHNLLLTNHSPTSSLKIADFGFARHLEEASLARTLCGSPLYMAPEILAHQTYDAKADLWSVGTILFEMLAGKPPFEGRDPKELLHNIQRIELRMPTTADTTPDAVDLLRRLLRRKPTERISFQEFFESKYLSLKPLPEKTHDQKLFSNVDANPSSKVLPTVLEDSDGGSSVGSDTADGPTFAPSTDANSSSGGAVKEISVDDGNWEFVEESLIEKKSNIAPPTVSISITKPPLPPSKQKLQQQLPVLAAKRRHASGRATAFAVQVAERAVHLAKMAERIVEAFEEFEGMERCECANTAAAAIVVEAVRLLSLALAAAEDAAEAARRKNRVGDTNVLVQEMKAWLIACKEKADGLLQASSSSVSVPNPRIIMFKVALGLGRRAAGRELLLVDAIDPKPELATVLEDYSIGLMLLQLLTANNELNVEDRKQIHGFLALFHARLNNVE